MFSKTLRTDLDKSETHEHSHEQNRFAVTPIGAKLSADPRFTGRGVRIAFLDSGFYPHADFADRVVSFHDAAGEEKSFQTIGEPQAIHWHGTQTVTVCAGNGKLSDGVYRGLASDSELVLVKVSSGGKISDEFVRKGLLWVLENCERLKIRILNISLGGDTDVSTNESAINEIAEELIRKGVCITVAAGNSSDSHSIPPASSPSVLTIGGYGDDNQFLVENFELYHSNFGKTIDGIVKPEIIAPAMNVAAPILPGTNEYKTAETLSMLAKAPDYALRILLGEYGEKAGLPDYINLHDNDSARELIERKIHERKIIAAHYQHVDGTSFAAPAAASVVAQMLEANPALTPAAVKNILISTARKLSHQPAIRQGYGVLNAGLAVTQALGETHFLDHRNYAPPRVEQGKIVFSYHDDSAQKVFLAGDFNDWKTDETQFEKCPDGVWRAAINCLPGGKYRYKFYIGKNLWTEDASHGLKEEDGFGGFHSILLVE